MGLDGRFGEERRGGCGETFGYRLGRGARDPGALPGANLDHAHLLKVKQRLAHGRPADPEAHHKVAFRRQLIARREIRVPDHLLQSGGDILIESAPFDDREAHLVYLSYHSMSKATAVAGREAIPLVRLASC